MKKVLFPLMAVVVLLAACGPQKFKTNENGLQYKIYEVSVDTNDRAPVKGDIITAKIAYYTEDTLIFDMPEAQQMMTPESSYPGDLWEGLSMMTTGDSATFLLGADDFFRKTLGFRGEELPFELDSSSVIMCDVAIDAVMDEATAKNQREAELAALENEEISKLQAYITDNNITVEPTATGLYIIPTEKGNGKKAEAGKTMVMHYTGKFLDGKVFDSSVERGQPFDFVLGQGNVIKGWDEGVATMRVGDKATFVIPSKIAYGQGRRGIPAYSTLVFDVELIDVK